MEAPLSPRSTAIQNWKECAVNLDKCKIFQFPIDTFPTEYLSERLQNFLASGERPKSNEEIGLLFWEYNELIGPRHDDIVASDFETNSCRYLILKDVKHLDLTAVHCQNSGNDWETLRRLCRFVRQNFEGTEISFKGLSINQNLPSYTTNNYRDAILSLIEGNPNLTSMNFVESQCVIYLARNLPGALQVHKTITELNFDGCMLTELHVEQLVVAAKHNPSLNILNLKNNRITHYIAIDLLSIPTITSLNIENNPLCNSGEDAIWEALQKNTTIVSFDFNWENQELKLLCEQHLKNNLLAKINTVFQQNYTFFRNLYLSSDSMDAPTDVVRLIKENHRDIILKDHF